MSAENESREIVLRKACSRLADAGFYGLAEMLTCVTAKDTAEIVRLRGEVEREERSHGLTIDQRDRAYGVIDSVYMAVMDESPEWSSAYGFADALNDIEDRVNAIRTASIAPAEAKGDVRQEIVRRAIAHMRDNPQPASGEFVFDEKLSAILSELTNPQPADGGAVEPFGWAIIGPNGATFVQNTHPHIAEAVRANASDIVTVTDVYTHPPAARVQQEAVDRDAWAEALELPDGYTVEEFLPGGWHYAWTRADGERMVSGTTWSHPALAAIAAWQYGAPPHPAVDALGAVPPVGYYGDCIEILSDLRGLRLLNLYGSADEVDRARDALGTAIAALRQSADAQEGEATSCEHCGGPVLTGCVSCGEAHAPPSAGDALGAVRDVGDSWKGEAERLATVIEIALREMRGSRDYLERARREHIEFAALRPSAGEGNGVVS